jgi:uncharacterized membrane protein YebE (DUF533 family)
MFDAKSLLDSLMRGAAPDQAAKPRGEDSAGGNPLGDLLAKLQQAGQGAGGAGGIADILGQVVGQATSGVREGAGKVDQATGASARMRDVMGQLTGKSPDEMIAQVKELIAKNQLGTGAALGGLGALILGTGAGRGLAGSAVKLGGLALIGGLAYKAYQNYQQGLPPLTGSKAGPATGEPQALLAAPSGSGFEADAASNDQAALLIRAMIAAAAADGRIDDAERRKIMSGLDQAGLDAEARQFLAGEFENPATIDDLAEASSSPEEAVRIYTAARIAVDIDTDAEHAFLAALADRLDIDDDLVVHIDAAARSTG